MAASSRSAEFDRLQVRSLYARTDTNIPIPSSFILIADGNGATHWSSISSVLPISSFKTVKGNGPTTFSADLCYNVLQISTTGVQGTLESYVDIPSKSLMLSNAFPPVGFGNYPRIVDITEGNATALAGGAYMNPIQGNSTMKFIGIGDIKLSTISTATTSATFFYISTYTSVGYSTLSGEVFALKSRVPSRFSAARATPTFTSSFSSNVNWVMGSQTATTSGSDYYLSTAAFPVNHLSTYIDISGSTKMFVDYYPNLIFSGYSANGIKPISTFLSNVGIGGYLPESVVTNSILTQQTSLSNSFTTPLKMEINPYSVGANSLNNIFAQGAGQNLQVVHRVVGGAFNSADYQNLQSAQNSLFVTLTNSGPLY